MIHYIYADQLENFPVLADSMFKDRAYQFKDRHNWDVTVNENGHEIDQYDAMNPLYVIWQNEDGTHGGSIRIMPTVGQIMTNDYFSHLTDGVKISSPVIWECTRFCLAPGAGPNVAAALLAAGLELGIRFGLDQAIGVIYTRTHAIYRRIGWVPEIIGTDGDDREAISIGVWDISTEARDELCRKSGISADDMAYWFDASFNANFNDESLAAA